MNQAPSVFVVDLNREIVRESDQANDNKPFSVEIYKDRFTFPMTLDLSSSSSLCQPSISTSASASASHEDELLYELHGVIGYNSDEKQYFSIVYVDYLHWLKYQGRNVSLWDVNELSEYCYGGENSNTVAIMLFYKRMRIQSNATP
jgi:hypothetical protein